MDDYTPSPDPELPPAGARRADVTPEPVAVPQALQALRDAIPPMLHALQALHAAIPPDGMLDDVAHEQPVAPLSPIVEPAKRDSEQHVLITLRNREWNDAMEFKCKSTATKFETIAQAYADKKGVDRKSLRFAFDGERLRFNRRETLGELYDGDIVDVTIM
ncbi:hypothetical protein GGF32_000134 [Allomyces javanicus]|nr:hypothetical protein GGF32_000134 [Allomyces javanicus]